MCLQRKGNTMILLRYLQWHCVLHTIQDPRVKSYREHKAGFQCRLRSCSQQCLYVMLFLSRAAVLWKLNVLNNSDKNICGSYISWLLCLFRYKYKNSKHMWFVFVFFYLPAPPDNPAVHGDTREPPVYSWTGPPHSGCVSAVLCSAGLRDHSRTESSLQDFNEFNFFLMAKLNMGMEELFD